MQLIYQVISLCSRQKEGYSQIDVQLLRSLLQGELASLQGTSIGGQTLAIHKVKSLIPVVVQVIVRKLLSTSGNPEHSTLRSIIQFSSKGNESKSGNDGRLEAADQYSSQLYIAR